jgi:circadian clock protein KaiB
MRKAVKPDDTTWQLNLYVADETLGSIRALRHLRSLCHERLPGRCRIRVVDIRAHPSVARAENIVAIPTLVRKSPKPERRVIGDLSDTRRLLGRLDLLPA